MAAKSKKRKEDSQLAPEIQAAIDHGIDISALKANLRLSVAERLRQHQKALNTMIGIEKARFKKRLTKKPPSSSKR